MMRSNRRATVPPNRRAEPSVPDVALDCHPERADEYETVPARPRFVMVDSSPRVSGIQDAPCLRFPNSEGGALTRRERTGA